MTLDLDFVRSQFPAFREPSLAGFAHFENAGGSYAAGQTIAWLERYYRQTRVQPYYAFPASARAGEQMDAAKTRLAAWLNAGADELHFGPSTSQNTFVLAQALRRHLKPGDEVIVTNQDHEANVGAYARLADDGIVVREWKVNPATAELERRDLEALLGPRTKLVAFTHCSNVVGSINPVREFADLAHRAGAWAFVDGVAFSPHGLPDVRELGVDAYYFSLYKVYGPHLGALFLRREVNEALPNQGHFFNDGLPEKRFTPAGPDHAQIAAVNGVADYLDAVADHHGQARQARAGARRRRAQPVPRRTKPPCSSPCSISSATPEGAAHRPHARGGSRADGRFHGERPELGQHCERTRRRGPRRRCRQLLCLSPGPGARHRHRRRRGARLVRALHVEGRSGPAVAGDSTDA